MAHFPGHYGIFPSSNYLPDSWATPFCFTQTKDSSFFVCVFSLSQQSILSRWVYLVGGFHF